MYILQNLTVKESENYSKIAFWIEWGITDKLFYNATYTAIISGVDIKTSHWSILLSVEQQKWFLYTKFASFFPFNFECRFHYKECDPNSWILLLKCVFVPSLNAYLVPSPCVCIYSWRMMMIRHVVKGVQWFIMHRWTWVQLWKTPRNGAGTWTCLPSNEKYGPRIKVV